jgi:hypothetical protein
MEYFYLFFLAMSNKVLITFLGLQKLICSSKTTLPPAVTEFCEEEVIEAHVAAAAVDNFVSIEFISY